MKTFLKTVVVAAGALIAAAASAQDYPNRPITIIVGYGAGGSTDLATRVVAAHMEKTLGQPIVIENKTGGNGAVGTQAVFNAAPDGYTLGMTSGSILTVLPWTMDLGFDPLKLTFIGSVLESRYALFTGANSKFSTIEELIDWAKAHPNELVAANSGGFGLPDIAMAQLSDAVGGITYRTLPTSGGAEQVVKLLAGDADVAPNSAAPTKPHLASGKIRPLLVLSPDWPELEKMGVPVAQKLYGFSVRNLSALVAPPGLPEDIRQKLEDALKAAMDDPEVRKRMDEGVGENTDFKTGAEIKQAAIETQAAQKAAGEKYKPK
jgi:tripartite-type tricarboxylate transporter receptor subunit TctC